MSQPWIRIGTRGSPLALAQANETRMRLARAHGIPEERMELVVIKTTGDQIQDRALSESGGKGLFTKEIDQAMLDGAIDIAVHSAKDLPTLTPEGIVIAGYLPREDVRDVFISTRAASIMDLPQGAVVGSASLRRQALVRRMRPDLRVTLLRGNVQTRLRKVESGEVDGTLLALAGLKRLGLEHHASEILDPAGFLPPVGQAAIAITAMGDHAQALAWLEPILCRKTGVALAAERAFLTALDGSCRTPIAGHATVEGETVSFEGMILRADGSEVWSVSRAGPAAGAEAMGREAGRDILARAPRDVLPH